VRYSVVDRKSRSANFALTAFSEALATERCTPHAVCLHFPYRQDDDEEERHMDEWHDFFLAQAGARESSPGWCSSGSPLTCSMGGLYWLVADMVFSILVALFEAWVLLIEINR
jgi:hypothetical protein